MCCRDVDAVYVSYDSECVLLCLLPHMLPVFHQVQTHFLHERSSPPPSSASRHCILT